MNNHNKACVEFEEKLNQIKIPCQIALRETYGFAPGLDEIEIVDTDWEDYSIIYINGKTYTIKGTQAEKVKIVAHYRRFYVEKA